MTEGTVKLNEIYMRDPFVYVENDVCYLVGTTDETAWNGPASGFLGYKSTDLVNFDGPYRLFEANGNFWANENFWAPELHKIDGKYCLFASFKREGHCRASQVLVSDEPLGKYVPAKKPFTPDGWECLDATYYREDGKNYTVFVKEWLQVSDGEMWLGELNDTFDGLKGTPKLLFTASQAPWSIAHNGKDHVTDGPFVHKLKNGTLIMLWSSHGKDGYAMGYAVSDNGKLSGNWIQNETPVFAKDGGHGMIFEFKGEKYITLHCPNDPHMSERPHFFKLTEDGNKITLR